MSCDLSYTPRTECVQRPSPRAKETLNLRLFVPNDVKGIKELYFGLCIRKQKCMCNMNKLSVS